ncbi:DNA-binding protein [Mesorhizobium soli]|uniref:DNA-binding protein n=1 Tax=Pseudaminobacter soli (ex Li et al. 2025) TaxID=1295366 RepID=A0A2P7S0I0_9HYPH|nr:DNA-binding protein [Mesorhizobium soli]
MRSVAGRFGFSVTTLRHRKDRARRPERPSSVYGLAIDRAPPAVQKALQAA